MFGQTAGHDFVNFDDNRYVYENGPVRRGLTRENVGWAFTHVVADNWHPLTTISHMLDCQFHNLQAGRHHLTNVFLHSVAVVLLFLVLSAMAGKVWPSAFVAAFFAIHPLRTESVAWISERKDVLSGVFFMLTLASYVAYTHRRSLGRYALVFLCVALGLLSKPTLVTLPFVLLLVDYWPLQRWTGTSNQAAGTIAQPVGLSWLLVEKLPLFFLAIASCITTVWAQQFALGSLEAYPIALRLTNALLACVTYIAQMFWPARLAAFYPYPSAVPWWQSALAAAFLLAMSIFAWISRSRRPYMLVGWLWYLGMLIPVIGIVQVGWHARADRYTYLPHIGLLIMLTWAVAEAAAARRNARIIFAGIGTLSIMALAAQARTQTSYWKDGIALWNHTLAVTENNDRAHICLAGALMAQGRIEEAIFHSRAANKIRIDNAAAYGGIPVVFDNEEKEKALAHWEDQLQANPNDVAAHNSIGVVLFQAGRVQEAMAHWQRSLEIQPGEGNAQSSLAWVLATYPEASMRDGAKAIEFGENTARLSEWMNPIVLRTLAAAYAEAGRFADAIGVARRAVDLANSQRNPALAANLEAEIGLYQRNIPLRDNSPAAAQTR